MNLENRIYKWNPKFPMYWKQTDGLPVPIEYNNKEQWLAANMGFESPDRIIAQSLFFDIWISTVFLPISMNIGSSTPICYETMIFCEDHDFDGHQDRYARRDEAMAGHLECCREVMAHLGRMGLGRSNTIDAWDIHRGVKKERSPLTDAEKERKEWEKIPDEAYMAYIKRLFTSDP